MTRNIMLALVICFLGVGAQAKKDMDGESPRFMKKLESLNLPEEKRTEIKSLSKEHRKSQAELRHKKMSVHKDLTEAWRRGAQDSEITKIHENLHQITQEINSAALAFRLKVRSMIPDEENKKKFGEMMLDGSEKHRRMFKKHR